MSETTAKSPEPPVTPRTQAALSEYSATERTVQALAIVTFGALAAYLVSRLAAFERPSQGWIIGAAALSGYVTADFLSGLAHWLFDTWGSIYTPVLGKSVIRPFREHHWDQKAITRHGFIETNGNNCFASLPVLAGACFIPTTTNRGLFAMTFMLSTSLGVLATNQFHKWAHVDDLGRFIGLLQRSHVILPTAHHEIHHTAPYQTYYCITTGWLNPLLCATEFYRRVEHVITAVTGAEPRKDDLA